MPGFIREALPLHLLVNMLMVWVLGSAAEQLFGHVRFILLYLGGCIFSVVPFLVFTAAGNQGPDGAKVEQAAVDFWRDGGVCPHVRVGAVFFVHPAQPGLLTSAAGLRWTFFLFQHSAGIRRAPIGGALFGVVFAFASVRRQRHEKVVDN